MGRLKSSSGWDPRCHLPQGCCRTSAPCFLCPTFSLTQAGWLFHYKQFLKKINKRKVEKETRGRLWNFHEWQDARMREDISQNFTYLIYLMKTCRRLNSSEQRPCVQSDMLLANSWAQTVQAGFCRKPEGTTVWLALLAEKRESFFLSATNLRSSVTRMNGMAMARLNFLKIEALQEKERKPDRKEKLLRDDQCPIALSETRWIQGKKWGTSGGVRDLRTMHEGLPKFSWLSVLSA